MTANNPASISSQTRMLLGIDTGGTFTDFVLWTGEAIHTHKVLSTPNAPQDAVLQGISALAPIIGNAELLIIHGTTVATNAALQHKGVETVYIANEGLGDLLSIGRQTRRELYNLTPQPHRFPVPDDHIIEVGVRMAANGQVLKPLSESDVRKLKQCVAQLQPKAIAINLLFSFLDDRHERQIAELFEDDYFVSRSSDVLPEYREYERGIATWLNAWLGPITRDYLLALRDWVAPSPLTIMQSSGLTMHVDQALGRAVNLLLSGPAAGLAAARYMGSLADRSRLITFDMGGTSTDVALIDGEVRLTREGRINGYPVAVPMTDMHTIGAGGGSIAYIDAGGLLQVGPESSAADPGPACYGLGGDRPTVTDANLVMGRLRPGNFLGGNMSLDVLAAKRAIGTLAGQLTMNTEDTAAGIIQVANEKMIQALRVISVQRGHDPRQFQLVCFGGAGGLHVCSLAEALGIEQLLVPVYGGVLSAFGMLVAPPGRELSRTFFASLDEVLTDDMTGRFDELRRLGEREMAVEGHSLETLQVIHSVDLRYVGQTHTLNVPWTNTINVRSQFHRLHQRRYGHALTLPVELVNLAINIRAPGLDVALPILSFDGIQGRPEALQLPGVERPVSLLDRAQLGKGALLAGPCLITETSATTLITSGWSGVVDEVGNILINRD